jgi:hypothetical protein
MTAAAVSGLRELAAKHAIENALSMHSRGVDRADYGLLASAYHDDATVDYGFFAGPARQLAEILAGAQKGQPVTMHRTSNMWIDVDGDEARSESYVVAAIEQANPAGAVRCMVGGRYLDSHARRAGSWRLTHRKYVMDWNTNRPSTSSWPEPAVALGQFLPRGGQGAVDPGRALLTAAYTSVNHLGGRSMSAKPRDADIDVVLSKQALHELCMAYARGVDRADPTLLASLFHEDSSVISGVINASGPQFAREITAFVRGNLERCFHSVANMWFEIDGDGAVGESYVIAVATAGGNDVMTGGRYIDAFERRNGKWKFKSRSFVIDWSSTQPTSHETGGMYAALTTRGSYGTSDPVYSFWR